MIFWAKNHANCFIAREVLVKNCTHVSCFFFMYKMQIRNGHIFKKMFLLHDVENIR